MQLDSYTLTVQGDQVVSVKEIFLFHGGGARQEVVDRRDGQFYLESYSDHMCETMKPFPQEVTLEQLDHKIQHLMQLTADQIRQMEIDGSFRNTKVTVRYI